MFRRFALACLAVLVPAALYAQQPVKIVDSTGTDVPVATTTEAQHDTALGTVTNNKGLLDFCRARATMPSGVSADDDAVLGLCNLFGARAMFLTANAFGGADTCPLQSAASTNATLCANAPGTIYDISLVNITSTTYFLRLYNLSAAPTCSSATGFVETIPVPHNATAGGGIVKTFPVGRAYSTGIAFCLTGGGSPTDNTNAATGVYVSIGYKK